MKLRKDALLAASKFIIKVNEIALKAKGNHVATVGKINAMPGAFNVIPGKVVLGLEIRDLSFEKIEILFTEMEKQAAKIAIETKTKINFERRGNSIKPALTNRTLQQIIEKSANTMGLSTKYMQKWCRTRRSRNSLICSNWDDFRSKYRGHQSFTKRIYNRSGYGQRSKRIASNHFGIG